MNSTKLKVKVIPQGKCNKVEQVVLDDKGDICLKVRVTAPPTDGKANEAVIKLLAEHYHVPKSAFTIEAGRTSRHKVLTAVGIERAVLLKGVQKCLSLDA